MSFSSIKRKPCKNASCHKFPVIGKLGYCSFECMPEDLRVRETAKSVQKRKNQYNAALSRKLHRVGNGTKKEISFKFEPRSSLKNDSTIPDKGELLALADKLFSQYIKKRDAVDGVITCVCCGGRYDVTAKDSSGDKIVQCLHFVSRRVYSLRFSPINCHAGCSSCNRDMFENETGLAYRQFRSYLVSCVGEMDVREMEKQKREINKLSAGFLQEVIDRYSLKKTKWKC